MAQNKIVYPLPVVIAGSAGSLTEVLKIVEGLRVSRKVFYIIVLHRKHEYDGALESLIQSHTALRVKAVEDKEKVDAGTIYVAPADYHLLMDDSEIFSLDRSEKVHFSRPSIDVTMESVTDVYGGNMIAVLLSGANFDGTAGLKKVKQAGGITIVQDPESAAVREMPESAIKTGSAVLVQTTDNIVTSINKLISDGTV